MRSFKAILGGLAVLTLILSGCGGGSSSSTPAPGTGTSPPPPVTGSATLSWSAPTTNTNGTALTDLAGYHVYYGPDGNSLTTRIDISSPSTLSYVVTGLAAGTWYFAITAFTSTGEESAKSNVGSKTIA